MAESALYSKRNNTVLLKFNEKLDVNEDRSVSLSEFNMEPFIRAIGDIIEHFGLDTFFYVIDSDRIMKYLPEESYNFNLSTVLN